MRGWVRRAWRRELEGHRRLIRGVRGHYRRVRAAASVSAVTGRVYRPATVTVDPHAGEVARFRCAVHDYSREGTT